MATKKSALTVSIPSNLNLTKSEASALKKGFRAELANVLKARPAKSSENIFSEINIISSPRRTTKRPTKQSAKASKKK